MLDRLVANLARFIFDLPFRHLGLLWLARYSLAWLIVEHLRRPRSLLIQAHFRLADTCDTGGRLYHLKKVLELDPKNLRALLARAHLRIPWPLPLDWQTPLGSDPLGGIIALRPRCIVPCAD
jgi:hypothetical protein